MKGKKIHRRGEKKVSGRTKKGWGLRVGTHGGTLLAKPAGKKDSEKEGERTCAKTRTSGSRKSVLYSRTIRGENQFPGESKRVGIAKKV